MIGATDYLSHSFGQLVFGSYRLSDHNKNFGQIAAYLQIHTLPRHCWIGFDGSLVIYNIAVAASFCLNVKLYFKSSFYTIAKISQSNMNSDYAFDHLYVVVTCTTTSDTGML